MVQFINVDMSLAFNSPCTEANFMPAAMSFMNRDEYTVNITFLMIFLVGGNPTGPYIIGDGGVVQNTEGMWTGPEYVEGNVWQIDFTTVQNDAKGEKATSLAAHLAPLDTLSIDQLKGLTSSLDKASGDEKTSAETKSQIQKTLSEIEAVVVQKRGD